MSVAERIEAEAKDARISELEAQLASPPRGRQKAEDSGGSGLSVNDQWRGLRSSETTIDVPGDEHVNVAAIHMSLGR